MHSRFLPVFILQIGLAHLASGAVVYTLNDSGPGSLRQAIADAVTGEPIIFHAWGAIRLTSGSILIGKSVSIEGPGVRRLLIYQERMTPAQPLFEIAPGASVSIRDLTMGQGFFLSAGDFPPGGGAIRNFGELTVRRCRFGEHETSYAHGGAVYNAGRASFFDCTFIRNRCYPGQGGAIYNAGELHVERSLFSRQDVVGDGGAIFNADTARVIECAFESNSSNGHAPAIASSEGSTLNVDGSTFQDGLAFDGDGGAIALFGSANVHIRNSTFSGNEARLGRGGAIWAHGGLLVVESSTIVFNVASDLVAGISDTRFGRGGGIALETGASSGLKNCIIAANRSERHLGAIGRLLPPLGPDLFGHFDSKGYNLIGDAGGALLEPDTGDQIGSATSPINPRVGPLEDNGGPTKTHALLDGSTAIDRGSCDGIYAPVPADQRGVPRPQNLVCDIGAFERAPAGDPPMAVCLPERTVVADSNTSMAQVGLTALVRDPDGDSLSIEWRFNGQVFHKDLIQTRPNGVPAKTSAELQLPTGYHFIEFRVSDGIYTVGCSTGVMVLEPASK